MELPPPEVYQDKPPEQVPLICGRWAVMRGLGVGFTPEKMRQIARGEMEGYEFAGAVMKTWTGLFGKGGLTPGDIEVEAQSQGVFDDVFNYRYGPNSSDL